MRLRAAAPCDSVLGQQREVPPINVSEPATRQSDPVTVVPGQREAAEQTGVPAVAVDHVRKHGRSCYWDVADCRWRCG
jgi:hypothetical protein